MIQMTDGGTASDAATNDDAQSDVTTDASTSGGPSFTTGMEETTSDTTDALTSSESSDAGGGMACANVDSCNAATVLGTVSGDETSPLLHASGSEPTWVTFQVTENNDGLTGESVSFKATLTSPVGYDFDLYAFRGSDGGTTGCGGVTDESTAVGELDLVSMSWGEGGVANGGDESAWVALQIEVKNGICDPTLEWTLEVEGDI
jgi:hypothetical protein